MNSKTYIQSIKDQIQEVSCEDLKQSQDHDTPVEVIDIRGDDERMSGIIPNAHQISRDFLELKVEDAITDPITPIVLYCAGGTRSALSVKTLKEMGYKNVLSLKGGFQAWKQKGYPIQNTTNLPFSDRQRYARHLNLPQIQEDGQRKILDAKVLLVGLGGLGSPVALYLAAAGVGTLGLIDDDVVDASNLQRQVLYREKDVGLKKVDVAKDEILQINSKIQIKTFDQRLQAQNAFDIIKDYDVIVNGCDNFATRYLVNDACFLQKKCLVDGSIHQFTGQVSVYNFQNQDQSCYRCLFPNPPKDAQNCAEAGVLGVLPGTIGMIQATETLKLILNLGEPLQNKLLTYDALKQNFKTLNLKQDSNCSLCGDNPSIKDLVDYDWFCQTGESKKHAI